MTLPVDSLAPLFGQSALFSRDCPAISATITLALGSLSSARAFRITRVEVMVDATYAADATNFYALALAHGAGPTTAASWSTATGSEGALTAATPGLMTLAADANLVVPAAATVKLVATKNAAAANITPRIVVHGRYVTAG